MAKDAITETEFTRKDKVGVETGTRPDAVKADAKDDQSIKVRALRTFHKEENMQGDMTKPGDEFDCPRSRAAQLRANGLIEYVNDKDGVRIHGEDGDAKISEQVARDAKLREMPEKHKGTPLRNPELKLADAPKGDDKK